VLRDIGEYLLSLLLKFQKIYIYEIYKCICDVNMVQAMINIDENVNRVLNIVKAKHGLKDKSEAINLVVTEYEEGFLEPELRPEYKKKLLKIMKEKHLSREEFEKAVG